MRDMKKQAEKGAEIIKKHARADMSALEYYQFEEIAKTDPQFTVYNVSVTAFNAGVACGYRLAKTEAKKKRTH